MAIIDMKKKMKRQTRMMDRIYPMNYDFKYITTGTGYSIVNRSKKDLEMSTVKIMFITTKNIESMGIENPFAEKMIAFLEHVAFPEDLFYQEVHAEIILGNVCYSAVGKYPEPCVITYNFPSELARLPCVEIVDIPVTDVRLAAEFLLKAATTPATYKIPILDFAIPKSILDKTDPELDFMQPSTWSHLYCSQFVLLFLRYCAHMQIIPIEPHKLKKAIYSVNSHCCSPAKLAHIIYDLIK